MKKDRDILLDDLAALNDDLEALGARPLISTRAGRALPDDDLLAAVHTTADYLIDVTHKLRGF